MKLVTDKMRSVAGKLKANAALTAGERNLAKNVLLEQATAIDNKSAASTNVEKSDDIDKVKNREKVLKYRIKTRLKELMEGME